MKHDSLLRLRETKYARLPLEKISLDGTFTGYASLFDVVDMGNDVVLPGAFSRSLHKRGTEGVRMLFQHNPDEPIGVWREITEDARGLKVTGQITKTVARGAEVLELMRAGAIDGLSIGFKTQRSRTDPAKKTRKIVAADLWEISVVTFPMQVGARIDSLKSRHTARSLNQRPSIREFEHWLTRDAGLTRREARTVIQKATRNWTACRTLLSPTNQAWPTRFVRPQQDYQQGTDNGKTGNQTRP